MSLRPLRFPALACCGLLLPMLLGYPAEAGPRGAAGTLLRVGPGREYKVPSEAAAVARDGDTVEIDAGTYDGDVAVWRADDLTLRGVGDGRAHLRAGGKAAEAKAIWVIKGDDTTVENIEFSGASVPDGNGAGIRQEGDNLTVRGSYFHDNEMGLLAGDNPRSKIIIEYSMFADSRSDRALAHNIYVNGVKRFILRYSYSHGATIGHNVKSRAKRTDILYNRLADEADGRSSYVLDIPNAGRAYVIGNVIQQGPNADNSTVIAYGEEGYNHASNKLFLVHNTIVNDRGSGRFVWVDGSPRLVKLLNNLLVGPGALGDDGSWQMEGNLLRQTDPGFIDAGKYDYRLRAGSAAIDAGAAVAPPRLRPKFHYLETAAREPRPVSGAPDAGAYER